MKHCQCIHYVNLDCEKGLCALSKCVVPIDGEGSESCPEFVQAKFCSNCVHFSNPDKYGIGTCSGFEKENWSYATCGAFSCEKYENGK